MLVSPAETIGQATGQVRHVPTGLPWLRENVAPACANPFAALVFDDAGELHNPRHATRTAKAICATCPYFKPCREWGIQNAEGWGVWGGLNRYERRREAKRRGLGDQLAALDDE